MYQVAQAKGHIVANIQKPARIVASDFDEEIRPTVEKMADVINPALEEFWQTLQGELSLSNFKWGLLTNFIVKVDANGTPLVDGSDSRLTARIKNPSTGTIFGSLVVKATCIDDSSLFVTSTPYITFSVDQNNLLNIQNVSGLVANKRYQLNILIFTN